MVTLVTVAGLTSYVAQYVITVTIYD